MPARILRTQRDLATLLMVGFKKFTNKKASKAFLFFLLLIFIYYLINFEDNKSRLLNNNQLQKNESLLTTFGNESVLDDSSVDSDNYPIASEDQASTNNPPPIYSATNIINSVITNLPRNYTIGLAYIEARKMCKSSTYLSVENVIDYCKNIDFSTYDQNFINQLEKGFQERNFDAGEALIEFWNSELMLNRHGQFTKSDTHSIDDASINNRVIEIFQKLNLINPTRATEVKSRLNLNF